MKKEMVKIIVYEANDMKDIFKDMNLHMLCRKVKDLCMKNEYKECNNIICKAMSRYPDSPVPHNLYGILLMQEGNSVFAMKHFRAAWALDPTYEPVQRNLHVYASFPCYYSDFAFDVSDVK